MAPNNAFASSFRTLTSVSALAMMLAMAPASAQDVQPEDALATGFKEPPAAARPRVWWHWLNGNITPEGLIKDLDWMKRAGIGGVQAFDAALNTPQIVDHRLVYMSPEWKSAFRSAVSHADKLGLEFGIATSPGWSETGGPWVASEDGMKKVVWSETIVRGGKRFAGMLGRPPSNAGPYQDVPGEEGGPDIYHDTIVLAYPVQAMSTVLRPEVALSNGSEIDATTLLDGKATTGVPVPETIAGSPGTLTFRFSSPRTVRSITLFIANSGAGGLTGPLAPTLEASDDGKSWRKVVKISQKNVPTTASFTAVTARQFRLVMTRGKGENYSNLEFARGVDLAAAAGISSDGPGAPTKTRLLTEFRLDTASRINAAEQKAAFVMADNYAVLDASTGPNIAGVDPAKVIDLTRKMSPDGRLDWTAPSGYWRVVRMGYSLKGTTNHPATKEATGLEVDKYDAGAVKRYLDTYIDMYRNVTGPDLLGKKGLTALVSDSAEYGPANWTPKMIEQFQRLRGYDPRPWLLTLTGIVIGSRERSDAFLYDYRRTLGELLATEHYGTVADVAHRNNLIVYGESLEGGRDTVGDDLELRRFADVPMSAIWTFRKAPFPGYVADIRGAASNAHIYGRKFVASESLTATLSPWAFAPSDLQPMIDAAFAHGINRPFIHSSVHQPADKAPGVALAVFGQYFNRLETWAEMARPWTDYLARNSFMLQQGRNVADIGYFYGEDTPAGKQGADGGLKGAPIHNAYDLISRDALLNELSVDNGDLVSPGGARYRALYLGGESNAMTITTLHKLEALVEAGATVIGQPPTRTLGLKDDAAEFKGVVAKLWRGGSVGRGRVVASTDVETALETLGIAPDFVYHDVLGTGDMLFAHRRLESGELYFLSSRGSDPRQLDARFRVTGKIPELWHADTGKITPVSYRIEGSETIVPLSFGAKESMFVVFRKPTSVNAVTVRTPTRAPVVSLDGADVTPVFSSSWS